MQGSAAADLRQMAQDEASLTGPSDRSERIEAIAAEIDTLRAALSRIGRGEAQGAEAVSLARAALGWSPE